MVERKKELLQEILKAAGKCDRCGNCLLVCPVTTVNSKETCNPRGMINAALALVQGGVAPEPQILAAVDYCLLCGACIDVCPSKIKVPTVLLKVRQYLADLSDKNASFSLEQQERINSAFDELCERCAAIEEAENSVRKAAYFFSCQARLNGMEAAAATVRLLSKTADVELVNNECCGLPLLARGLVGEYKELLQENIKLYEDYDIIVADCACCADTLKKSAEYLAESKEWQDSAKAFSKKVILLSSYLQLAGYQATNSNVSATYHDPCLANRNLKIKKQPRELLQQAADYIEMQCADSCCGGPCFFPADYPETACALLAKKAENIEKSGAAVVATECYNCLRQLKQAAEQSNGKFKAVHISELL